MAGISHFWRLPNIPKPGFGGARSLYRQNCHVSAPCRFRRRLRRSFVDLSQLWLRPKEPHRLGSFTLGMGSIENGPFFVGLVKSEKNNLHVWSNKSKFTSPSICCMCHYDDRCHQNSMVFDPQKRPVVMGTRSPIPRISSICRKLDPSWCHGFQLKLILEGTTWPMATAPTFTRMGPSIKACPSGRCPGACPSFFPAELPQFWWTIREGLGRYYTYILYYILIYEYNSWYYNMILYDIKWYYMILYDEYIYTYIHIYIALRLIPYITGWLNTTLMTNSVWVQEGTPIFWALFWDWCSGQFRNDLQDGRVLSFTLWLWLTVCHGIDGP